MQLLSYISDKRAVFIPSELWLINNRRIFSFFPFWGFPQFFPRFFVSVFVFSTDREKILIYFFCFMKWTKFLQKSFVPLFTPLTFVYKLQKQSFLAIDALCSKHNKGLTDNETFFYLIFPRRVLCYFSQNIMGTEQLPHLIPLKQNTYTFWSAGEFFSHSFQQTFAPSCFFVFTVF